jgi:hypothetical protein
MDKSLAMAILIDLETSLRMIDFALDEKNTILAKEALANAELEVTTLRQILEDRPSHSRQTFRS